MTRPTSIARLHSSVVERITSNDEVVGSTPAGGKRVYFCVFLSLFV